MLSTRSLLVSAILPAFLLSAAAQTTTPNACPAPPNILASTQPNIFSEQQEQWLGDAMADMIEADYRPVQNPAENAYLNRIAKRLLAVLPPTSIQFHIILVDSPEVNGFSLAGGRIYLTRKLVANARSEDEVASVMAHEMGHILTHQFAYETTADLKRLLNVTSVTDKADIYAKFQRLVDARMKDKHPGKDGNSDEGQDEADVIAVYATAAAGYRPQAYSEFWDRMFFVDGKVGGPLSDFFGATKPESKRLRAMLKLINALPPGCGGTEPSADPDFQKWHALVVANQPANYALDLKPVSEVALNPPLRMDLGQLRFSRDGKYILAQDETSIFVFSRDPYKELFRIEAENALPAQFSPDSQQIVFHTPGLHTERWSIPEQKLLESHEPLSRYNCIQSKLSPDGRTLFCISLAEMHKVLSMDLTMLDVATGNVLFQKKNFFIPSLGFYVELSVLSRFSSTVDLIPSSISADGHYILIGPSAEMLAFDLITRKPVPIGGDLKTRVTGAYAFLGNDRVVGVSKENHYLSGVFSFPDGKRLQSVPFGLTNLQSVTSGNYVMSRDVQDYAIALADVSAAKLVAASKSPAMDVWNGGMLNENADGSVVLHKLGDKSLADQTITLPLSPLGSAVLASTSPDGRLLALSSHTRGGVWDLQTGQRLMLSHRFTSGVFTADNSFYAEFPAVGKQARSIVQFQFAPLVGTPVAYKLTDNAGLGQRLFQEWKPAGKNGVEMIVHNIADDSVLWRRTFPAGQPAFTYNLLPGQTIFSFPLKTDNAKDLLKAAPDLADQVSAIKNRDAGRIIQIVDSATGSVLHQLVLEVPLTYEGVRGINVVGNNLYLSSEDNRTMVYNLQTGAQLHQIFGYVIALDSNSNRICTVNRRDEATVFDADGRQVASFRTGSRLRFASFRKNGNQLLLLTADQKVRTMDIANAPASPQIP